MSEQNSAAKPRRRWIILSVIVLVSAIAGGIITASAKAYMIKRYVHYYHSIDQKTAEKKATRLGKRIARKVGANSEQREKIVKITTSLATDLLPFREKLRATRGQLRTLLTQDTVDRAKIEAYRAEKIALVDSISKRVTVAITDLAEVLTVEQRKKVSKRYFKRRHFEK